MNAIALEPIPSAGSHVGRYQFLREIAKGPFGPLYELRSAAEAAGLSGLGRLITLPSPLAPEVEQAISEAAWDSMELRHDLTLCVADVVFGKGWVALVHDYAEGSMLRALQRRALERQSAFPVAVALRIVMDLLEGLELNRRTCEDAGITWRPGGTNATSLYLCGDGHTRALDGQVMGTLLRFAPLRAHASAVGYPPPELLTTEPSIDERTDVFTVGAVLWELLTGRELTLGSAIAAGQRPRPQAPNLSLSVPKGTKLPTSLTQAVQAALELEPSKRPSSRNELKSLLTNAVEVATYEKVIDYTDALLNRESTLFRLTLDRGPKLSDEMRSERPNPTQMEWVLDLAKHARSVEEKRGERPIRPVDAGDAKPVPSLPSEIFERPNKPTPAQSNEGAVRPNKPTPLQSSEGAVRPSKPTPSIPSEGAVRPSKPTPSIPSEGAVRPNKPTPLQSSEGAVRPNKPTPAQSNEGAVRPSKPTPSIPSEGAVRPSKPTPQSTAPIIGNKKLPSRTLMGISPIAATQVPTVAREARAAAATGTASPETLPLPAKTAPLPTTTASPPGVPAPIPGAYDDDATMELEMPPPAVIVDASVANPAPTRGAAALLDASIEQLAAEKAARIAERMRDPSHMDALASGAIPRSASDNAAMVNPIARQLPVPVEARQQAPEVNPSAKVPRWRVVQVSVPLLLVGFLGTVVVSVLTTIAFVHVLGGPARATAGARNPVSVANVAPSASASMGDRSPSANTAPSALSVPQAVEPQPSAPQASASQPSASQASASPPLPAPSTNVSGPAAPPTPQKTINRKRREQYVPHGL